MSKPKIGVVGCGSWSTEMHLPAMLNLAKQGVVEYVAVCDLNEDAAKAYAEKTALNAYMDITTEVTYSVIGHDNIHYIHTHAPPKDKVVHGSYIRPSKKNADHQLTAESTGIVITN